MLKMERMGQIASRCVTLSDHTKIYVKYLWNVLLMILTIVWCQQLSLAWEDNDTRASTETSHTSMNYESAKWRAQRAHVPYVAYVPTRPTCPMCPRAQVYFTDWKIKKWKFCTHTFLRVLSLTLSLNFRNYRFIQTSWLSLFSGTHRRKIPNRVFLLQQTYFLQQ